MHGSPPWPKRYRKTSSLPYRTCLLYTSGSRGLSIFVFNVQQIRGKTLTKHSESLDYLKSCLLYTSRYDSYCAMYDEVKDVKDWQRPKV